MPHNYGLISEVDAGVIEKTLGMIMLEFVSQPINVVEIGIYGGATGKGIKQYIESNGRKCFLTGIDNNADGEPIINAPYYDKLIGNNSVDAAYLIENNSQHFVFIDGNHSYASVISDFFCYARKVRTDGFIGFHDTGKHIKKMYDWQKLGSKEDPHQYISVREALQVIGLYNKDVQPKTWELIFDEADENDEAGGVCTFKKNY
jgi:hypothetical protein